MKLSDVIRGMDGTLLSDGEVRSIAFATEETQSEFLTFLEKAKFLPALNNPGISCVLIKPELAGSVPPHIQGVFICDYPKAALFTIHNALASEEAYVGPSFPTRIGKNCNISPLAVIPEQNVIIGDEVTIEPFVVIRERTTIGSRVTIRAGAIIGGSAYAYASKGAQYLRAEDTASIEIGDDVDIFEQVCIERSTFPWEKTAIGRNSKLGINCGIGHGSCVGENCEIAGKSTCCGYCTIGNNVWIGPGAIISNRKVIGDNARVTIGSVVAGNVPAGAEYTGNFAMPHQQFMRNYMLSLRKSGAAPKKSLTSKQTASDCPPPADTQG